MEQTDNPVSDFKVLPPAEPEAPAKANPAPC